MSTIIHVFDWRTPYDAPHVVLYKMYSSATGLIASVHLYERMSANYNTKHTHNTVKAERVALC